MRAHNRIPGLEPDDLGVEGGLIGHHLQFELIQAFRPHNPALFHELLELLEGDRFAGAIADVRPGDREQAQGDCEKNEDTPVERAAARLTLLVGIVGSLIRRLFVSHVRRVKSRPEAIGPEGTQSKPMTSKEN